MRGTDGILEQFILIGLRMMLFGLNLIDAQMYEHTVNIIYFALLNQFNDGAKRV